MKKITTLHLTMLLFGVIFTQSACQTADKNNPSAAKSGAVTSVAANNLNDTIKITTLNYQKDSGCENESQSCAKINLRYFKAEGGHLGVADSINMQVHNVLISILLNTGIDSALLAQNKAAKTDIEEAARVFIKDYGNSSKLFGYEAISDTVFIEILPKHVSIGLSGYIHTGGPHGYDFVSLINLDRQTGRRLQPQDFIADEESLVKIAEVYFRKRRELTPDDSLSKSGYFWNNRLFLPTNMALRSDGLYLHYNPYEIAAYFMGSTEFMIPYSALGNSIKMEW